MNRFQVCTERRGNHLLYTLKDMQTGALARIAPGLGGNCLELRLATPGLPQPVAIINDLQHLEEVPQQVSRYGIPVLFPWPSGIGGGGFRFQGETYTLNKPGERNSRHHGFVNAAPWRVVRSDCDNSGAWLTCTVRSEDCSPLAAVYPASWSLELTWKLTPRALEISAIARNTGPKPMPMGFGLHPYFTIPLGPKGSRDRCRVSADVGRQWDLKATTQVGPGDPAPTSQYQPQPDFDYSVSGGAPLGDIKFDDVMAAAPPAPGGRSRAVLHDPDNGLRVIVDASPEFTTWVFFTPAGRSAISLEPWTMVANGFNLMDKQIENTGVVVLKPDEAWSGNVKFSLEHYTP